MIHDTTLLATLNSLGFQSPTPVQRQALPVSISGRDCVVQAKTGSGKTLAFVLPLYLHVKKVSATNQNRVSALVIAPTRELAVQIREVFRSISQDIVPACLIGGEDIAAQKNALERDGRVVIGTPGRILDCIRQRILSLKHCSYFVLDEADETLSIGFLQDVRAILSRLPDKRQGMFVSATITPRVDMLANSFLTNALPIVVDDSTKDLPPVEHMYCDIAGDILAKPSALCDLIETFRPRSAIIFCNTKSDTQLVEVLLRRRGFDARRINSDLSQAQRTRIMSLIRKDELQFLVATDVAARGLDLEQIDLVINYSIHDHPEVYLHRTGRTGRAGRSGKAISLVGPRDFSNFHSLQKLLNVPFQKITLPTDEEVAGARLAHLHELLRKSGVEIKSREELVAKQLLLEMGEITTPSEELAEIIAKLCHYTIAHFVAQEAESLDEELSHEVKKREQDEESGEHRRSREPSRERRERSRDERGDRHREHPQSREERPRNDRPRREEREDRGNRDSRDRHSRDRNPRDRAPRNGDRRERGQGDRERGEEVRVYIGQGFQQGLTSDIFSALVEDNTSVSGRDLRKLTIREHYGFVDLYRRQAETLIGELNGVEFSGEPLPIEFATVINKPRPHHSAPRGGHRQSRERDHDRGRDRQPRSRGRRWD